MQASTRTVIQKVRELLAEPEHWGKGWFAYDGWGQRVYFASRGAPPHPPERFCLAGAVYAATGFYTPTTDGVPSGMSHRDSSEALDVLERTLRQRLDLDESLPTFNDHIAEHADILNLLDAALEEVV